MQEEFKVAEDVALIEVKAFIEYHQDCTISDDRGSDQFIDIPKVYKDILKAVKRGLLDLSDNDAPVLTLRQPLVSEGGNYNTDKITFLTRITKSKMAQLSRGFDVVKNPLGFANVMTAYYTQQPSVAILDKFGKTDMATIDELVGLFQ